MSREMDALIGAAVTVILVSFVPFSPLVGGAVSGYLHQQDGITVGALSGIFALIPVLLVAFIVGIFATAFIAISPAFSLIGLVLLFIVVGFLAAYVIGLSAAGGVIGVYIHERA